MVQSTFGYWLLILMENCLQKKIMPKERRMRKAMMPKTWMVLLVKSAAVQCLFSQMMLVGSVDSTKTRS